MKHLSPCLIVLCAMFAAAPAPATAQMQGVKITRLLQTQPSGDDSRDVLVVTAEFEPGASTGRHSHPGDEYATVLEGGVEVRTDGQAPRQIKAGEAYHNARGAVHETVNTGKQRTRIVATFVIDKGKPLVQPASP